MYVTLAFRPSKGRCPARAFGRQSPSRCGLSISGRSLVRRPAGRQESQPRTLPNCELSRCPPVRNSSSIKGFSGKHAAGETRKRRLSFSICDSLSLRFLCRTSETRLSAPKIETKFSRRRPFASSSARKTSTEEAPDPAFCSAALQGGSLCLVLVAPPSRRRSSGLNCYLT